MGYEILQSSWFWPLMLFIVVGYYAWVLLTYFKGALKMPLARYGLKKQISGKSISLNWEELVLGFDLHRRLIANPRTQLSDEEQRLLKKSPVRELILQTTSK